MDKIKITDIIPSEYNPRLISETEFNDLKNSISEFGFVDPIIVNLKNNHIIGGHQRYDVLMDEYIKDNSKYAELNLVRLGDVGWCFPDVDLSIVSDEHEKALNVALNKISGDWDVEKLTDVLFDLDVSGFDLGLTGFNDDEINTFLSAEDNFDNVSEDLDEDNSEDYLLEEEKNDIKETINDEDEETTNETAKIENEEDFKLFKLVINCKSEKEQNKLYDDLLEQGYKCQILTL